MSDYIVSAVPASLIDIVWPQVEPLLQKPIELAHGETDINAVYNNLKTANILLCTVSQGPVIVAAFTLEFREFESGLKTMYLPLIGGTNMRHWMDQGLKVVEAIGKDFKCTELRGISVRKGWMRILEKKGWEEVSVTVRCPIGGEE